MKKLLMFLCFGLVTINALAALDEADDSSPVFDPAAKRPAQTTLRPTTNNVDYSGCMFNSNMMPPASPVYQINSEGSLRYNEDDDRYVSITKNRQEEVLALATPPWEPMESDEINPDKVVSITLKKKDGKTQWVEYRNNPKEIERVTGEMRANGQQTPLMTSFRDTYGFKNVNGKQVCFIKDSSAKYTDGKEYTFYENSLCENVLRASRAQGVSVEKLVSCRNTLDGLDKFIQDTASKVKADGNKILAVQSPSGPQAIVSADKKNTGAVSDWNNMRLFASCEYYQNLYGLKVQPRAIDRFVSPKGQNVLDGKAD